MHEGSDADPALEEAAARLGALGSPARMRILAALATPRLVTEIYLPTERGDAPVTRQSIQAHLDKLVEAGFVEIGTAFRNGRRYKTYVARPDAMRATRLILERVARSTEPEEHAATDGTYVLPPPAEVDGPRLVLLAGAEHVGVFPVRELPRGGSWRIGRSPDVEIVIHGDPFVSPSNAYLVRTPDAFVVRDAPGSANGTTVNGRKLAPHEVHTLSDGDVVGIGRSALLFRSGAVETLP